MVKRVADADLRTAQEGRGADVRALAKGSALSLAGTVGQGVLSLALVLVITRSLGPRGAGFFFQMVALFTIFSAIEMGADTGLVRFVSRFKVLHRRQDLGMTFKLALYPVVAMSLAIGAATFMAAPALARLIFSAAFVEDATLAIRILALFQPIAAVSDVLVGGTRGFGTVVPYVAVEALGKPFLRLALVLLAVAAGLAGVGSIVAWAIPIAVGLPIVAIWNVVLLRRLDASEPILPSTPRTRTRDLAAEFWRFCIPQGLSALLLIGVRWLDVLLVGAHVDNYVAVVLVVVCSVEYQDRAARCLAATTVWCSCLHQLVEVGICRRGIHVVAIGKRFVQRLHECSLLGRFLGVLRQWRCSPFA